MDKHFTYLALNVCTVLFPLLLSFDKKVQFYKSWKHLFPSLLISGVLYLIWDFIFTFKQVWSFNSDYILGINLFNLPLEEILFFITVPFACLFIYACIGSYFKTSYLNKFVSVINCSLIALSLVLLILFYNRIYSLVNFATLACLMVYIQIKKPAYIGQFYLAYFISLLPFYIINGYLTSLPVVIYHPLENMGFRVGTIPFEDHFYSLSLMLLNVLFYEYFKSNSKLNEY